MIDVRPSLTINERPTLGEWRIILFIAENEEEEFNKWFDQHAGFAKPLRFQLRASCVISFKVTVSKVNEALAWKLRWQ